MAPASFSHALDTFEPGSNLGESDRACEIRLEAEGANRNSNLHALSSPQTEILLPDNRGSVPCGSGNSRPQFVNGWFCTRCDRVTEHEKVKGRQVCLECGYQMGKPSKDDKDRLAAQQRDYRAKNKDRLVAQKRDYYAKNKDRLVAQQRDYRAKNKDRLAAQQRDYRAKNKDKIRTYQREWCKRRRLEKKLEAIKMEARRD